MRGAFSTAMHSMRERRHLRHAPQSPRQNTSFDLPPVDSVNLGEASPTGGAVAAGEFEPVSGVVKRELRPSSGGAFTCHAFSADGKYLLTGESNGTLSLWYTENYRPLACWPAFLKAAVSAVSFFNGDNHSLVAVDRGGNVRDFKYSAHSEKNLELGDRIQPSSIAFNVHSDEHAGDYPESLRHQFSDDGKILVSVHHPYFSAKPQRWDTEIRVHKIDQSNSSDDSNKISISLKTQLPCVPILSKNGESLLLLKCPERLPALIDGNSTIQVWPKLIFGGPEQEPVQIKGLRGSWGKAGEYLIVSDIEENTPKICIYETGTLSSHRCKAVPPPRERELRPGLTSWNATMLPEQSIDDECQAVLIYEESGEKRNFLFWDLKENQVTIEVDLTLAPNNGIIPQGTSSRRQRNASCSAVSTEAIEFFQSAEKSLFPLFCWSLDKKWVGAISTACSTVGLSSMETGLTSWVSTFESDQVGKDLGAMPLHVEFDPTGVHLLMFGAEVIRAFGPSFLNKNLIAAHHIDDVEHDEELAGHVRRRKKLHDCYQRLPSRALAKAWESGASPRSAALSWFRHENEKDEKVIDASLSVNKELLALILEKENGSYVCLRHTDLADVEYGSYCLFLTFPMPLERYSQSFNPERILLVHEESQENKMVFLTTGQKPLALFCQLDGQKKDVVDLYMSACFKICASDNSREALLVDDSGVCVLDLEQRKIRDRIPYKSRFEDLLRNLQYSLQWQNERGSDQRDAHFDGRIAADGRAVLLAWDLKHKRSIIITPDMGQSESEDLVKNSARCLSDFCALSPSGKYTAFVDIEELAGGRLTISVFSERDKEVVFLVAVDQNLPRNMRMEEEYEVLGSVFYGFAGENEEFLVVNTSSSGPEPRTATRLRDRSNKFRIVRDTCCKPDYNLLRFLKGKADETSLEELNASNDESVLNLLMPIGRTALQNAITENKTEAVKRIIALARKKKTKLALEWETEDGGWEDILQAAIKQNSTNDIKFAVETVCSDVAPFGTGSRIMRRSFLRLVREYPEILEDALLKNKPGLMHNAGQLDVHIDFMNRQTRKENAVHIGTSDSWLEWEHMENETDRSSFWKTRNRDKVKKMEADGDTSPARASLQLVRIADAAKVGMKGIIRPLLMARAPTRFYSSKAVKLVIQCKWFGVWKRRLLHELAFYALFLLAFTLYAIFVAAPMHSGRADYSLKDVPKLLLCAVYPYAFYMIAIELRQAKNFLREGREHFGHIRLGLSYYFLSKWNWLDLVCGFLLGIIIPALHFGSMFDHQLRKVFSVFVALESILVYAKAWYYFQPFRSTGSMVLMMTNIVYDCAACMALALLYTIGFGLALFILFNFAEYESTLVSWNKSDLHDAEDKEFKNFPLSLLTLFYAFLGTFEPEIYHFDESVLSWAITLVFVTFLLVQTLLLLNLLIAVMGDTFDRVKAAEEAVFLQKQAQHIDALEAELTAAEAEQINATIGKYVHMLCYPDGEDHNDEEWTGRTNMIQESIKASVHECQEVLQQRIDGAVQKMDERIDEAVQNMDKRLDKLCETATQINELRTQTAELMKKADSVLEAYKRGN